MVTTRRPALLAIGLIVLAACTPGPSMGSPSPATASPSHGPTLSAPAGARYPVLLIRVETDDGLRWYATVTDDPSRRHRITAPPGAAALGPVGADGTLPMISGSGLLLTALIGDGLIVERTVDLGRLGMGTGTPACLSPDGSVAVADNETLALTVVPPTGSAIPMDVPGALGECAWLVDGRILVVRDGDQLLAVDPASGAARPVSGGSGRHPFVGGDRLSLVERSGGALGAARVVVRGGGLGGPAGTLLAPPLFSISPGPGGLISRAQLSADGAWLAVELTLDPDGIADRRLRLYRLSDGAAEFVTEVRLGPREQVIVLPAS